MRPTTSFNGLASLEFNGWRVFGSYISSGILLLEFYCWKSPSSEDIGPHWSRCGQRCGGCCNATHADSQRATAGQWPSTLAVAWASAALCVGLYLPSLLRSMTAGSTSEIPRFGLRSRGKQSVPIGAVILVHLAEQLVLRHNSELFSFPSIASILSSEIRPPNCKLAYI